MRLPFVFPAFVLAVSSIVGGALLATDDADRGQATHSPPTSPEPVVTAVAGPSWLNHLNISYRDTGLGRGSGRYGPAPTEPQLAQGPLTPFVSGKPTVLTGADLYRMNCQACHRAEGTGAPPEIRSLIYLVQGSSFELVRRQLQQQKKAAPENVRRQATAARATLSLRIHRGGQRMPPLEHLDTTDVDVLYPYLTQLAEAPDSPRPSRRTVSWARLGEQVVKGTCHICHDAVGPRPSSEAMRQGVIPPLSAVVADNSQSEFIRKVRNGAAVFVGRPLEHYRGRMPVFYYLRDQELGAAYDFLLAYPPQAARLEPDRR